MNQNSQPNRHWLPLAAIHAIRASVFVSEAALPDIQQCKYIDDAGDDEPQRIETTLAPDATAQHALR